MTGRTLVARVLGRAVLALVVVGGLVVAGVAVQDRDEVRADAHALTHDAVADLVAAREGRERIEGLEDDVDASQAAQRRDDLATVAIITALDERETLQDRIELAQLELDRAREVSAEQVARLDVLKACVHHLELARARYVAGDRAGAIAAHAAGEDVCLEAEAITEGVAAVHPFDFPDPQILREGDMYFAFGTNGPAGVVQVVSSTDLTDWDVQGSALDAVPAWAHEGFTWAPAAIRTWSGFSLFYTVRDKASGRQCISRATAAAPGGPYVDRSTGPLVCQVDMGGSIDPSPFVAQDGTLHLTWKSEGEVVGGGAQIWSAPLTPDGGALAWFPTPLLTVDKAWEGRTIEGPSMARTAAGWILLYSGNRWDSGAYATGYATCAGPTGPCTKPADNVVLRSDGDREGPGGAELFRTTDGQLKVAYAAWDTGEVGIPNPRRLHLGTVSMTPLGLRIS
ncbi:family 43 glycosylhydrolase [Iamia sp. SCSIO 61187]|uniref:family 43 glycosylhydrolase n=1 Tax=Iamia sp. SCSIO 61187 TaxID=2722752 RepID=UPI001C63702B|nr:family 43 glycosylhydrolase [Iamia sp. SCSIO 61187]QYG91449.1 family 43 glycosylhydrolase [Iamia sp. SCSIO 61187]